MKYSLRYNGGTPDLITNPGYENKKTLTDKTVENYNPKQLEFDFKSDEDANKDPNILRRIKHYTEKYDGVNLGKDYEKAIAEEDKKLAKLGRNKNILQRNNDPYLKKLKEFGIENSQKKEPGYPKVSNAPILKNNINKPKYPERATPEQVGALAERLERSRQMTGGPDTWKLLKQAADTPEERNEIKKILNREYYKNGTKYLDKSDLKFIGKYKEPEYPKFTVPVIDTSILTVKEEPKEPEIPLDLKIKDLADKRLAREQDDWDRKWGRGGISDLKRPI